MTHTITALYDTRGAAETARDGLLDLGIHESAVSIRGTDMEAGGTATTAAEDKGFWGSLGDLFMPDEDRSTYSEGMRRGGYLVSVEVEENMTSQAEDVLERSDPVDVDERSATWRQEGWSGASTGAGYGLAENRSSNLAADRPAATDIDTTLSGNTRAETDQANDEKIQVVDEQLKVGKRQTGGGSVRVRTYVKERPVEAQVDLRSEHVTVERTPVDREVAPGVAAFEEKTIEAVEHGEEAVVAKTARVKEEISLHKDVETHTETVRDTVRETEVDVDDGRITEVDRKDRDRV